MAMRVGYGLRRALHATVALASHCPAQRPSAVIGVINHPSRRYLAEWNILIWSAVWAGLGWAGLESSIQVTI